MQTFLPYPDFVRSAQVLDSRRLGKQRVEALQLLNVARRGYNGAWARHPASRMWRGYEGALARYHDAMVSEWIRRGYRNTMPFLSGTEPAAMPPWLGDPALHASHRSALLRKNPNHYGRFGWTEPPDLPYHWPV